MGLLIMSAFGFVVLVTTAAAVTVAVRKVRPGRGDAPSDAAPAVSAPAQPPAEVPEAITADVVGEAERWLRHQAPPRS